MTLTRGPKTATEGHAVVGRGPLPFTWVLLPASVALWALGISQTHVKTLEPWGLLPNLPAVFWAGVALLVVSAAIELARDHPSRTWMALHAVALAIMLYGTAPLVYSQSRYAWVYKTAGVVQYVNAHGQLDRHIDIYQNWPGFFALAAWFDKVAGVASPLAYAKWAQLVFELAALPLLYLIYRALRLTERQLWVAMLLYPAANWIGQDYLSPQALGTLLSLGIMAIALRWLHGIGPAGDGSSRFLPLRLNRNNRMARSADAQRNRAAERARRGWLERLGFRRNAGFCVVLMLVFFVLTFTHELSPYIVAIQLGTLAAVRLLRPRWIPVALLAIAFGYVAPRFAFVNQHFGLLASIGKFFSNIEPPSRSFAAVPISQQLIERSADALSVGMWAGAALSGWRRRRLGRIGLTPVLLAFSPIVVLVAQAYGHEGILRVYLFSLPWTAALVASLLVPGKELAAPAGKHGAPGRRWLGSIRRTGVPDVADYKARRRRLSPGTVRAPLAIALALALFFPAFFGDDSFNVMPEADVSTVTSFLQDASPGPIYAIQNDPLTDTARYNQFPWLHIFGRDGLVKTVATPGIADEIANDALSYTHGSAPAYILVTPSMLAYMRVYGLAPSNGPRVLLSGLAQSPSWKLVLHRHGVWIYALPPAAPPIGTSNGGGGSGHNPQPPPSAPRRPQSIRSAGQSLNAIAQQFSQEFGSAITPEQVVSTTYAYQQGQLSAKLRAYMNAGKWNAPTPVGQHFWA